MRRVLAVSSGGGHWAQLQLMRPAFAGCEVVFACTRPGADATGHLLPDCNLLHPLRVLQTGVAAARLVAELRPEVVISTGAAPGALAVMMGKLFGARTIWIDSVANAERVSLSGRLVRRWCDLWLTQWPDLAKSTGARFEGRLL